jgi:hypothetical protein
MSKVASKANNLIERFKISYFIQELNSNYILKVIESNPANL